MKKIIYIFFILPLISIQPSFAVSVQGQVKAYLIRSADIQQIKPINFNKITTDQTEGNVYMDPNTGNLQTNKANWIISTTGQRGQFKISGINKNVQVNIDKKITLYNDDRTNTLTITPQTNLPDNKLNITDENNTFYVGGTLNVPAKTIDSKYHGTYKINIGY